MRLEVAVCLPREAVTVGMVRAAVTTMLRRSGIDDGCVHDIGLALSEACTNAVLHASTVDEYEVRVRVDTNRCTISVADNGGGFDPDTLTGVMPSADSPRGRGVAIMHAVMDDVELESSPRAGTVVNLVRSLTTKTDS